MSFEDFYFKNIIAPSDRYLKIHIDVFKYLNNANLTIYFTALIYTSRKFGIENEWFWISRSYLSKEYPPCLTHRDARKRMDKKLTDLKLIKTKYSNTVPRKKLYKINMQGFKKIRAAIMAKELDSQWAQNAPTSGRKMSPSNIIPNNNILLVTSVTNNTSLTRREQISNGLKFTGRVPQVKELKLKHRRYVTLEHEIINHWNNPEHSAFFAKVNKRQPVIDLLLPMISGNSNYTEKQYAEIALSITLSINKCFQYFTNPAFRFGQRRKTSLKQFLTPITRHSPKAFDTIYRCIHLKRRSKTWLNIFRSCPNKWLDNKLLKRVNVNTEKHFNAKLIQIINVTPSTMDNKENALLRRAIELAQAFQDVNEFSVLSNLEDYIIYSRGKPQLYWFASKGFWNNTLTNWIVENNRAEGAAKI